MELNVITALSRRHVTVSYDGLIDHLYGDSTDGGPLTAYTCMKVVISRCRKKITEAKLNWSIETIYGQGHILHRRINDLEKRPIRQPKGQATKTPLAKSKR